MKNVFLIGLCSVCVSTGSGQSVRHFDNDELQEMRRSNPEAYNQLKLAKGYGRAASIAEIAVGLFIVYREGAAFGLYKTSRPAAHVLGIGNPYWGLEATGVIAIGIWPLYSAHRKHLMNAIALYDYGIRKATMKTAMNLGLSLNGINVRITF